MTFEIKTLDDPNILLEINNAAVPDVSSINLAQAEWMVGQCVAPGLALLDGQVAGVVVVMSDDCGYDSDYYRWFTDRYENFLYIDRVIVASWARSQGVARQLYQLIDLVAQDQKLAIVADVYSEPPNVPSLNLHRAMGFEEIGTQYIPSVNKMTSKLMKYVENAKVVTRP